MHETFIPLWQEKAVTSFCMQSPTIAQVLQCRSVQRLQVEEIGGVREVFPRGCTVVLWKNIWKEKVNYDLFEIFYGVFLRNTSYIFCIKIIWTVYMEQLSNSSCFCFFYKSLGLLFCTAVIHINVLLPFCLFVSFQSRKKNSVNITHSCIGEHHCLLLICLIFRT